MSDALKPESKDEREQVQAGARLYECWQRLLPDSRLARPRHTIRGPLGSMEQCFCVNCGRSGGFVTEAAIDHIFYLCDDCVLKHGDLPMPKVPDEWVRGPQQSHTQDL
jgi:hypothetical protein